jgi:hypothetical protein
MKVINAKRDKMLKSKKTLLEIMLNVKMPNVTQCRMIKTLTRNNVEYNKH